MKRDLKKCFWLILALVLFSVCFGLHGIPIWVRYSQGVVSSIWIKSLKPHDSLEVRLTVHGHTFRHVRGDFPGFMHVGVPTGRFAFFVTERNNGNNVDLHIYNLDSRKDMTIDAKGSTGLGYTMGSRFPDEEVEVLTSSNCIISLKDVANIRPPLQKVVYSINLNARMIDSVRIDYTDLKGNILSNKTVN